MSMNFRRAFSQMFLLCNIPNLGKDRVLSDHALRDLTGANSITPFTNLVELWLIASRVWEFFCAINYGGRM